MFPSITNATFDRQPAEATRPRSRREPHRLGLGAERPRFEATKLVTEARHESRPVKMHASLLVGVGVEHVQIDEIDVRIALLSSAHLRPPPSSRLSISESSSSSGVTDDHLREMADTLRYALSEDSAAQTILDRIAEGTGLDDMFEDAVALAELVVRHAEKARDARKDPKKPAFRALEVEVCLSALVGHRRVRLSFVTHEVPRRQRAAHHLIDAIGEIQEAALQTFHRGAQEPACGAPRATQIGKRPVAANGAYRSAA